MIKPVIIDRSYWNMNNHQDSDSLILTIHDLCSSKWRKSFHKLLQVWKCNSSLRTRFRGETRSGGRQDFLYPKLWRGRSFFWWFFINFEKEFFVTFAFRRQQRLCRWVVLSREAMKEVHQSWDILPADHLWLSKMSERLGRTRRSSHLLLQTRRNESRFQQRNRGNWGCSGLFDGPEQRFQYHPSFLQSGWHL